MEPEDRTRRVEELIGVHLAVGDQNDGIFVFVPNPPTHAFADALADTALGEIVSWGTRGMAAAVRSVDDARTLAPHIFDLWSDNLFVIHFTRSGELNEVAQWIEAVALGPSHVGCPSYTIATFDWGDLVVQQFQSDP